MTIALLKEPEFENRVALTPDAVKKLIAANNLVWIEDHAGKNASLNNELYTQNGATIKTRKELLQEADFVVGIQPLQPDEIQQLKPNALLFGLYQPLTNQNLVDAARNQNIKLLSLDTIPRTTRAQSMDILSSMSTVSGYKAVLTAANELPRFFPMLMTAAGTIAPAKVLVIGAGVAGLQAIATAKRLGAVVEAFDTRPSVKEQVQSLGGKFVEVQGAVEDKNAGGYAVEQSDEYKQNQSIALENAVVKADVVISTALIPGKKAPILITNAMLEKMKTGSVIIDLAAIAGGNCEATQNNETVIYKGIKIIGQSNFPSTMPQDASAMVSKNIMNLLALLLKGNELYIDPNDDIIKGTTVS